MDGMNKNLIQLASSIWVEMRQKVGSRYHEYIFSFPGQSCQQKEEVGGLWGGAEIQQWCQRLGMQTHNVPHPMSSVHKQTHTLPLLMSLVC